MSQYFSLDDIIHLWKVDLVPPATSQDWGTPFHKVDIKERKKLLIELVHRVKVAGQPKEYFKPDVRKRIIDAIMPKGKRYPQETLRKRREASEEDLGTAIAEVYNNSNRNTKQTATQPTQQPIQSKTENTIFADDGSLDHLKHLNLRPHDPSRYADRGIPDIEEIGDEEVLKLLGLDKKV